MAEIDPELPDPHSEAFRGIWADVYNAAIQAAVDAINNHEGRLEVVEAIPPGVTPAAVAATLDDPLVQAPLIAQSRAATVRLQPVSLVSAAQGARREYPIALKPLTAPVMTFAEQSASSIYWPWLIDRWQGNPSVPAGQRYMLEWSTDHSTGGIYQATAATPEGPWTERPNVFNDAGGTSTETPSTMWNEAVGLWYRFYQLVTPGGAQVTRLATSPDLETWTVVGTVAAKDNLNPYVSHTGYFRPFRLYGRWYAYSLFGQGGGALWMSTDGLNWRRDARDLPTGQGLCTDLPGYTEAGQWRIRRNWGAVLMWNGTPTFVGAAGDYAPGGVLSMPRTVAVPLSADMRDFTSRPVDIHPPAQSWEGSDGGSLGNIVTLDDGRMVGIYRGGGKQGAFGLMEVA